MSIIVVLCLYFIVFYAFNSESCKIVMFVNLCGDCFKNFTISFDNVVRECGHLTIACLFKYWIDVSCFSCCDEKHIFLEFHNFLEFVYAR